MESYESRPFFVFILVFKFEDVAILFRGDSNLSGEKYHWVAASQKPIMKFQSKLCIISINSVRIHLKSILLKYILYIFLSEIQYLISILTIQFLSYIIYHKNLFLIYYSILEEMEGTDW